MLLVAGVTVVAGVTAIACIQTVALSSWWFPVAGLSAIADVPGVTNDVVGVSTVPFEHTVAGSPAVTAVTFVLSYGVWYAWSGWCARPLSLFLPPSLRNP
jgi:hypothetical protein